MGILNDAAEWERLHSEKYSLTCLCKNNELTMRNHRWRFSCKYRAPSRSGGCTDYEIIVFCQGPSELKKVWSSKAKAAVKYLKSQYKKRTQKKNRHTSRHQGHQNQTAIRQEIRETNKRCRTKGEGDFCESNLCSITYYSLRAKEGEDRIGTSLNDRRAYIKKKEGRFSFCVVKCHFDVQKPHPDGTEFIQTVILLK